jgi:hypothetical protein
MKTNLLHRLKSNARAGEKRIEPKSELTILLLFFVALGHDFDLCRCQFGETVVQHQFHIIFSGTQRPVAFFSLIPIQPVTLDVLGIVFYRTIQLSSSIKPDRFAPGEFLGPDGSDPDIVVTIARGISPGDGNFLA